jgi:hypothetical protein
LDLIPPAGHAQGVDDNLADPGLAELLQDGFVHHIVHTHAIQLAQRDRVVHVAVMEFDEIFRAQDAPVGEFVDEFGGDACCADGGHVFLGLGGASGEE